MIVKEKPVVIRLARDTAGGNYLVLTRDAVLVDVAKLLTLVDDAAREAVLAWIGEHLNPPVLAQPMPLPIATAPRDRLIWIFGRMSYGRKPDGTPDLAQHDWHKASWSGDFEGDTPYWRCVVPGYTTSIHDPTHWLDMPKPEVTP